MQTKGECDAGPRAAAPRSLPAEQVLDFLLSRNYLLTALELLQEANEAGLDEDVHQRLTALFQDPTLFPPEQVAACNPAGAANFLSVAHERQEKVSLLQYELAVAQEDLAALRRQKTCAAVGTSVSAMCRGASGEHQARALPGAATNGAADKCSQLAGAELQAVHRAVLAHLHAHGFKLAAMALSKEAQLPPTAAVGEGTDSAGALHTWFLAAQQVGCERERRLCLEAEAEQRKGELAELQQLLRQTMKKEQEASAELEFVRGKLHFLQQQQPAETSRLRPPDAVGADRQAPKPWDLREAGLSAVGAEAPQQQQQQQKESTAYTALGANSALAEVAACMPKVLPNLLINKRDELVPALTVLCQEHPEAAGRRQLAGLLFNLIKKPNVAQRKLIAEACTSLAKRIGGPRTMLDLLPHLEDQVMHDLIERRLLVADMVGVLAPHLPCAHGAAALLRLLGPLLQDNQPQVRCQALTSLARLAAGSNKDAETISSILRLLLTAAADSSTDVTHLLLQSAVPAVLSWLGQSELLITQLLPETLEELHRLLDRCPAAAGMLDTLMDSGSSLIRSVPAAVQSHAATLLQIYMAALPAVRTFALSTWPAWVVEAASAAVDGQLGTAMARHAATGSTGANHAAQQPHKAAAPAVPNPFAQLLANSNSASAAEPHQHTVNTSLSLVAAAVPDPFAMLPQQQVGSASSLNVPLTAALPAQYSGSSNAERSHLGASLQPQLASETGSGPLTAARGDSGVGPNPFNTVAAAAAAGILQHAADGMDQPSVNPFAASPQGLTVHSSSLKTLYLPVPSGTSSAGAQPNMSNSIADWHADSLHAAQLDGLGSPTGSSVPLLDPFCPTASAATAAHQVHSIHQGLPVEELAADATSSGIPPSAVQGPNPFAAPRSNPASRNSSSIVSAGMPWHQPPGASPSGSLLLDVTAASNAPNTSDNAPCWPLSDSTGTAAGIISGSNSLMERLSQQKLGYHGAAQQQHSTPPTLLGGTAHGFAAGVAQQQRLGAPDPAGLARAVQRSQLLESAAIAAWVDATSAQSQQSWLTLDYMAMGAVPALLKAALMVVPSPETVLLTQRMVTAVKATCLAFGDQFAGAVVAPQLRAAAGIPDGRNGASTAAASASAAAAATQVDEQEPQHIAAHQGCQTIQSRLAAVGALAPPESPAQLLAGVSCALPLLLAGVLPYVGAAAVGACLRRLCTDGRSGSGNVWAMEHPRAFVAAVRAASEVQLVQAQLVPVMWELAVSKQQSSRIAAALLAGAAAPSLYKQQVVRQMLPAITTLACDEDLAVSRTGIAAASTIFVSFSAEQEVQEALFSNLDDVLIKQGHAAEMALFTVLAPAAASASSQQLEWLLQRLLLMLAAMHQRAASGKTGSQLAEAAVKAFVALRQIEAHEFTEQRLYMHFVAALTALQREADLLEHSQRDALAAMIEDHEATLASTAASFCGGQCGVPQSAAIQSMLPGARNTMLPMNATPATLVHRLVAQAQPVLGGEGDKGRARLADLFWGPGLLGGGNDVPIWHFLQD